MKKYKLKIVIKSNIDDNIMNNILIISPHMDDEVLGCASFLQEEKIDKVIFYASTKHAIVESETLKEEHADLIDFLECKFRFMSFDAVNQLDTIPNQKLLNEFENLIMEVRPDTVLLANPSYNQDHRAIYEAMLTAL